ncbi:AI-2E family transporter [Geobacter argillaceus]|uniref:Putative PurR-regulated permease PerM n=1 Tax=Geobacter argillaceus TaxID=345631 RepID=A0A562V7Q3_9BACT|nr:AI-2E family transporter [Geobacter argillaceus]TWJ13767.1 putative PurR-regulated permease PerM [Geobacter argillaceus]
MTNRPPFLPYLIVFSVILLGYGIYQLGSIFFPLFIALLLAYLFEPLVIRLAELIRSRTLAIVIVFTGVILLLIGIAAFYATAIRNEFANVQLNLPLYAERFYAIIPHKVKSFLEIETPEKVQMQVNRALVQLKGVSFDLVRESLAVIRKAFSSTLAVVLAVLGYCITPLYLYYFLKDLPKLEEGVLALVPLRFREQCVTRSREIGGILSAFVRGQLLVCAILAVLYSIGLSLIGIDLAVVVGTLAGITFIIPYVGTILGIVLSTLLALLKFHDLLHPLFCLGWFVIVQALEGAVITPKIVGDRVGLHPVLTILALLIGGQLFGIAGMILAVPAAAVLKVFVGMLRDTYWGSGYFREEG